LPKASQLEKGRAEIRTRLGCKLWGVFSAHSASDLHTAVALPQEAETKSGNSISLHPSVWWVVKVKLWIGVKRRLRLR
jgi:hypothetical protein